MKTELLFVNPFAVETRLAPREHPQIDDRMADVEHGFALYIEAKLGKEAMGAYNTVVNAIVTDMGHPEDLITEEFFKKEVSEAWQDLGKTREWLRAQGPFAIPIDEAGLASIQPAKKEE
jgi:hypothetical protein